MNKEIQEKQHEYLWKSDRGKLLLINNNLESKRTILIIKRYRLAKWVFLKKGNLYSAL